LVTVGNEIDSTPTPAGSVAPSGSAIGAVEGGTVGGGAVGGVDVGVVGVDVGFDGAVGTVPVIEAGWGS
jgi:hypothetical protein